MCPKHAATLSKRPGAFGARGREGDNGIMRTLLKGTALLLGIVVVASCASTYNIRAETTTCTETRRACVAGCDTDECTAACSADERACLITVEQENEAAEGAADRQTAGLLAGLRGGLNVVALVSGTILTILVVDAVADYVDTQASDSN